MNAREVLCPLCESPMECRDKHGVEIDWCSRCRGVWLDRGELDSIVERAGRFLEIPRDPGTRPPGHRPRDFRADRFEWF
jgi:uncharacterized protein